MKHNASIKKNMIYQTAYEILTILLPFITSPYIVRVLGPGPLGIYSYTASVASYFVIFAMLGIKNHGNRSIAECRDDQGMLNKTFSNLFVLHLAVSVFFSVLYVIFILFFVKENILFASLQIFLVIAAVLDINWFYCGIEKFSLTVIRNTVAKIGTVVCIFVFVHTPGDLWKYTLIISLGSMISQSLVWFSLTKYVKFVRPSFSEMKRHIKPLLILFIPVIAISLYKYMDKIMLGNMTQIEQVGFYENSEKAINIPLSVITSFGTVMLPRMSNVVAKKDRKKSSEFLSISMRYIMMLAIAMTFGMAAVARLFSLVFWGKEFEQCGSIITLLVVTIPFTAFANVIRTQYLIPTKKDKRYILSVVMGAVVNFIANYFLIPRLAAAGAAVGTICAEVTVCFFQSEAVCRELPLLKYIKSFLFMFVPGMAMYATVVFMNGFMKVSVLSLVIEIATGAFVFILIASVYLYMIKDKTFISILDKVHGRMGNGERKSET